MWESINSANSSASSTVTDKYGVTYDMFAMDMAKDFNGPIGKKYQTAYKKYKSIILKKIMAQL